MLHSTLPKALVALGLALPLGSAALSPAHDIGPALEIGPGGSTVAPGADGGPQEVRRAVPGTLASVVESAKLIVVGRIAWTRAFTIDPGDGAPLVLTEVVVRGRALLGTALAPLAPMPATASLPPQDAEPAAQNQLVSFLVPGGLLEGGLDGSFTADAPHRHELRPGRGLVAFCADAHFMRAEGGELRRPMPIGGRAGLFNTFVGQDGRAVVQGRRAAGPLRRNVLLSRLEADIASMQSPAKER